MSMKKCSKCKKSKIESSFNKNCNEKDGLNHQCKICSREQVRNSYSKNRKHYIQNSHRIRKSIVEMVKKIKISKPCKDCGESYPYYVMDFDHRDGDDKSFCISTHLRKRGRNVVLAEIEKCDLVCSNCHRERTYQRKILKCTCSPLSLRTS
jgi:hypothetical protein